MSESEQELDKLDTQNARKGGPLSPVQRERKQKRFLKLYSECGNVKASCKAAGISRQTFYDWRDGDAAFKQLLDEAEPDVDDTLEYAAYDRAVRGVESFVVSMGRVVYEESPVLDKDGKPKVDEDGRVIFKRGKPIVERKYSDTLLVTLLKARMPEKYKERTQHEHTGAGGGPIKLDLSGLSDDELETLEQMAKKAQGGNS